MSPARASAVRCAQRVHLLRRRRALDSEVVVGAPRAAARRSKSSSSFERCPASIGAAAAAAAAAESAARRRQRARRRRPPSPRAASAPRRGSRLPPRSAGRPHHTPASCDRGSAHRAGACVRQRRQQLAPPLARLAGVAPRAWAPPPVAAADVKYVRREASRHARPRPRPAPLPAHAARRARGGLAPSAAPALVRRADDRATRRGCHVGSPPRAAAADISPRRSALAPSAPARRRATRRRGRRR